MATAADWLGAWDGRLSEHLPSPCGRVLFIGTGAGGAVDALRAAGIDAYGLNPLADRSRPILTFARASLSTWGRSASEPSMPPCWPVRWRWLVGPRWMS